MAKELAQDTELSEESDPIEIIKFKLQRTQKLLLIFAAACTASLLMGIALLVFTLMSAGQVKDIRGLLAETTTTQESESRIMAAQLAAALEENAQVRIKVAELDNQLTAVDINDYQNIAVKIQRIMIRQERDYRDFLVNLQRGLEGMHMMIPHSRGWWETYNEQVTESISLSEARENYILNMREN